MATPAAPPTVAESSKSSKTGYATADELKPFGLKPRGDGVTYSHPRLTCDTCSPNPCIFRHPKLGKTTGGRRSLKLDKCIGCKSGPCTAVQYDRAVPEMQAKMGAGEETKAGETKRGVAGQRGKWRFFPPKTSGGAMERRKEERDILKAGGKTGPAPSAVADLGATDQRLAVSNGFGSRGATIPPVGTFWKGKTGLPGTSARRGPVSVVIPTSRPLTSKAAPIGNEAGRFEAGKTRKVYQRPAHHRPGGFDLSSDSETADSDLRAPVPAQARLRGVSVDDGDADVDLDLECLSSPAIAPTDQDLPSGTAGSRDVARSTEVGEKRKRTSESEASREIDLAALTKPHCSSERATCAADNARAHEHTLLDFPLSQRMAQVWGAETSAIVQQVLRMEKDLARLSAVERRNEALEEENAGLKRAKMATSSTVGKSSANQAEAHRKCTIEVRNLQAKVATMRKDHTAALAAKTKIITALEKEMEAVKTEKADLQISWDMLESCFKGRNGAI